MHTLFRRLRRQSSPLVDHATLQRIASVGGVALRNLPFGVPKTYMVHILDNLLSVERLFDVDTMWYKGQIRLEEVLAPLHDALRELSALRIRVPHTSFALNLV